MAKKITNIWLGNGKELQHNS